MRTTSAAVLFLAGLCLGAGSAAAADRPQRPAPNITAAMDGAEIRTVRAFDAEVVKVAADLGLDPAQAMGFDDETDMCRLVARAKLDTPEDLAAFVRWRTLDGTKAGLLKLRMDSRCE